MIPPHNANRARRLCEKKNAAADQTCCCGEVITQHVPGTVTVIRSEGRDATSKNSAAAA